MMPYIWFGIALFMAIIEGVTYQLVSIWFVLGAVVSAIVSIFVPDNIWLQIILFIVISVATLIATKPIVKKITRTKKLPTNSDRYIGMKGVVKEEINNTLGVGLVNLKGSVWSATSDDGSVIPTDSVVIVKDIKGVKLIVSPVKEAPEGRTSKTSHWLSGVQVLILVS